MSNKNAARKRGSKAVAQARNTGGNRVAIIAGVVVVLVLAVVVVGAVVIAGKNRDTTAENGNIPVVTSGASAVPVALEEQSGTVVVGKDGAKATIDVYEDFLCPVCGQFEATYGKKIEAALTAGTLKVRYHVVNLLDAKSTPPGYSLLSANAALSVAKNNPAKFADFHDSLFGAQPREGGPGYTADQIVALGKELQVGGTYEQDVRNGAFDATVKAAYQKAGSDPALQQTQGGQSYFGTPTVASGGKVVDLNDPNWLAALTG
ncbi:DsbA family protein [Umezawaea tangerina]|uniref:Protein-disulfide isomerase n=1 Tax=Umezawaea tangerina TaxID=84725 RepID=A0A2T0SWT2_9PSEU|nr:thioredoxin domain-containing protein [Umezawaea tangerina]PRY37884.1 protein-disulfide isomerase [Umezawaea tangerina]